MTSSNGNIFRVTGHLCGEFSAPPPCEFPTQRPVTRSFDVFFDLHPNKRLSKQWWGWWFETSPCPLRRHRNEFKRGKNIYFVYGSKSIGPFSLFVFPGYRCDVVWRVYRPNWGNIYKKKIKGCCHNKWFGMYLYYIISLIQKSVPKWKWFIFFYKTYDDITNQERPILIVINKYVASSVDTDHVISEK